MVRIGWTISRTTCNVDRNARSNRSTRNGPPNRQTFPGTNERHATFVLFGWMERVWNQIWFGMPWWWRSLPSMSVPSFLRRIIFYLKCQTCIFRFILAGFIWKSIDQVANVKSIHPVRIHPQYEHILGKIWILFILNTNVNHYSYCSPRGSFDCTIKLSFVLKTFSNRFILLQIWPADLN